MSVQGVLHLRRLTGHERHPCPVAGDAQIDGFSRPAPYQLCLKPPDGELQGGEHLVEGKISRSGSRIPVVSTRQSIPRPASSSSSSRI